MATPHYPTLTNTRLTSGFGWRRHPVTGARQSHHDGIDLAPAVAGTTGLPVYAVMAGTVRNAEYNIISGNRVYIQHSGDRYTSVYCHLSSYSVKVGQRVKRGQRIGTMGTTGSSTGIHLHFGLSTRYPVKWSSVGTANGSFINPTSYLSSSKNNNNTSSGGTYKVVTNIKGYANAANAKSRKNGKSTIKAGTYHVFNRSNGMINVSNTPGAPGSWINPNDNKVASKPKGNPKIRTGGLNEANMNKVTRWLKENTDGWYYTFRGSGGNNPVLRTGGLNAAARKKFGAWLDGEGLWWTTEYTANHRTPTSDNIQIRTGGLSTQGAVGLVSAWLTRNKCYFVGISSGENPVIITGGMGTRIRKEFTDLLDEHGLWWKTV